MIINDDRYPGNEQTWSPITMPDSEVLWSWGPFRIGKPVTDGQPVITDLGRGTSVLAALPRETSFNLPTGTTDTDTKIPFWLVAGAGILLLLAIIRGK